MPETRLQSNAEAKALVTQAIQDYLKSKAFSKAIENALKEGIENRLDEFFVRIDSLEKRHTELTQQVEQNAGRTMELEVDNKAKSKEITRLKTTVAAQAEKLHTIETEINEMNQYSRRNCLKFYGVPESTDEITDDVICRIAAERLKVPLTTDDIDRSHRVAARKQSVSSTAETSTTDGAGGAQSRKKPRAIVVKFCTYRKRSAVLRVRKNLKGTGMAIDEALTAANQELLWTVKRHEKVKEAWSSDGRIVALLPATNGRTIKRVIRSKDELRNI